MLPKRTYVWECKVNEETSLYKHSKESVDINTLNTNDEKINHQLSYDVLIRDANFHEILVECNVTL